jgi:U3 small nucleolar RNA-associated protein 10
MCMLLVDKVANRATKQNADDARTTMSLPLILIQKHDAARQVAVLHAVLNETRRQIRNLAGEDQVTFLGDIVFVSLIFPYHRMLTNIPSDEGQSSSSANGLPRRVQALTMFVGFTAQQAPPTFLGIAEVSTEAVNSLVSSLLDTSGEMDSINAPEHAGISKAFQGTLHSVLGVVSAHTFLDVVLEMANSVNVKVSAHICIVDSALKACISAPRRCSSFGQGSD